MDFYVFCVLDKVAFPLKCTSFYIKYDWDVLSPHIKVAIFSQSFTENMAYAINLKPKWVGMPNY